MPNPVPKSLAQTMSRLETRLDLVKSSPASALSAREITALINLATEAVTAYHRETDA